MRKTIQRLLENVLLVGVALALVGSADAAVFAEVGDAGDTLGTAQATTGGSPLTAITGFIGPGANNADLYLILITNPAAFSATTVGGDTFNTQLFLFDASGIGVYANDNGAATFQSTLPAGDVNSPTTAGLYYLGISIANNDPESVGGLIFPTTLPTQVHGPTGPGGASPLSSWSHQGLDVPQDYTITLTGADVSTAQVVVPEPSTFFLFSVGAACVGFRSRRRCSRVA